MNTEQFLELTAELPEAMLLLSSDGEILAANRSASRYLRDPSSSLVGKPLCQFVADSPDKVQQALRLWSRTRVFTASGLTISCGNEQIPCRSEGLLLKPRSDSGPALILLRLIPRERSSQQFILLNHRLQELRQEVRRRRRAEEELRAQQEWLHVTLTSIGDAVIATDREGCVSLMNPVAESLTGWKNETAIGRPLQEVFHILNEDTRREVESPVDRVLRQGVVVGLANHTVLISRSGVERAIDDSAAPIRGGDGELRGVVLVFHDVSDRRLLERELRQRNAELQEADSRKDDFIAMLAHELRNPLAPIRTAAQILELNGSDRETVQQVAEIVERQSAHLAALVDDLLDVSRVTRGKISLRSERVDLTQLVNASVKGFSGRCERDGVQLTAVVAESPLWIYGDATRLTQIIDNLLDNACKFTEAGGTVTLRLDADAPRNQAVLSVKDTGIGLDQEMIKRLFVPFAQADRTLDRSKGGLGLGLALVKGLVDLHHGEVHASSAGVGRGAEFAVRLPLAQESSAATGVPSSAGSSQAALQVLIIEDNSDAANSLAMLVRLLGHQVSVAKTGNEGLTLALQQRPDLVLCDIGLPGMDGHEVARNLRMRPEHRKTRLVAITGYGQKADKERALQSGFDDHLTKPVDPSRLRKELAAAQS